MAFIMEQDMFLLQICATLSKKLGNMMCATIETGEGIMSLRYARGVDIGGTKIATTIIGQHYDIPYRRDEQSVTPNAESMFTKDVTCNKGLIDESIMDI